MSVTINSYGGILIWFMRKHFSEYTSKVVLEFTAKRYEKSIDKYIDFFGAETTLPLFKMVNIETINRCNGSCAFCPANIKDEKRVFKKMSDELFGEILDELYQINWTGQLFLNVNNEPLIDVGIVEKARRVKNTLGENVTLSMITNGSLLTIRKLEELSEYLDVLIINNYSEKYRLNKKNREIYTYVKAHVDKFRKTNITINRRYSREILATRAGGAPNKPKKNNTVNQPCIYPYTDITIFPDGVVGLCCNDCFEITAMGSVSENSLVEIWNGDKFNEVREKMKNGRVEHSFCTECDVVDAGHREKLIEISLK